MRMMDGVVVMMISIGTISGAAAADFGDLWKKYGGNSRIVERLGQAPSLPLRGAGERRTGEKSPGGQTVSIERKVRGRYVVDGEVNGRKIEFVVDTGAALVAFNKADAERLGVTISRLRPFGRVSTPGGATFAYRLPLSSLRVGDIMVRNVQAVVIPESTGSSLLGMTFLDRLRSYGVENGVMYLEGGS